jgi:hyperosmotically inducible protein
MNARHLMRIVLAAAVAVPLAACNRGDVSNVTAKQAAADARVAAAKAGDRIADGWLTTKIQAAYFADHDIKGRYIDVSTRDRHVTLTGYVDSDVQRARAEQIARGTDGVAAVNDELKIGVSPAGARGEVGTSGQAEPGPAGAVDDGLITSLIEARYFTDPLVKARTIEVTTVGGVVTLRGSVSNGEERARALTLARQTPGVTRVEDALTIGVRSPASN